MAYSYSLYIVLPFTHTHTAGAHHWLCISYGEDEVRLFDSLGLMMPVGSELNCIHLRI